MRLIPTRLKGPLLLEPEIFPDDRGVFYETFRADLMTGLDVTEQFVQDNHSRSERGVIRGMHFQIEPGVSKLVRCVRGEVFDVLVDLRRGSPTYGQWEDYSLGDENMRILYAPIGFAHGFCVISDVADVVYKQSVYYNPKVELGITPNDPDVGIDWPIPSAEWIILARDADAPRLRDLADDLPFEYVA